MRDMYYDSQPIERDDMIAVAKSQPETVRQLSARSEPPNSIGRSGVMAAAMNGQTARSLDGG
jgi:hypothetical protein